MQQYGNNGRPYDQNRDSLRSSGSSQRTTPPNDGASDTSRYGFNGEPLSRPPLIISSFLLFYFNSIKVRLER